MISTTPVVREGSESDLEQIAPLFVHSVDTTVPGVTFSAYPRYAIDAVITHLRQRLFPPHSHKTYVLELHTGEIVAYGNVKPNGGPQDKADADELDMFFVKAGLGGQGYGSQLMDAIQKDWGENGLWVRVFEKNERARRFYEKSGFRVVEKEELEMNLSDRVQKETVVLLYWIPHLIMIGPVARFWDVEVRRPRSTNVWKDGMGKDIKSLVWDRFLRNVVCTVKAMS